MPPAAVVPASTIDPLVASPTWLSRYWSAGQWLEEHVLAPLSGPGLPKDRVRAMSRRLREFYDSGRRSCLLHTLVVGSPGDRIREHIESSLRAWQAAMQEIARQAGRTRSEAKQRASEALVRIQGSLVVSRGLGDNQAFRRILSDLPDLLAGDDR